MKARNKLKTETMKTQILNNVKYFAILVVAFTFMSQNTNAQTTVGGGVAYGSEIENIGINLTGQYFIKDNIAIEGSFTYYLPKDFGNGLGTTGENFQIKWYEINANVNYYFDMPGKIKPYGLGGFNYSIISVPTFNIGSILTGGSAGVENVSSGKIGFNIGGGADFDLGKNFTPFAQIKYVLGDFDQLQLVAGVRFTL